MHFLVDFHYSDNWADPGKQCVPVAWQSLTTIAALATQVHDYTKDAIPSWSRRARARTWCRSATRSRPGC